MEPQILRGQVIHVNEDGWVVINRGAQDGVSEGLRFAVLGERNARQIRNLFDITDPSARPVVLRADTAYELLRVILVERQCCVAISDRVPPERTPQPFLGPQGELLIYTPPPPEWRYDALDLEEGTADASGAEDAEAKDADEEGAAEDDAEGEAREAEASEAASEEAATDDESAADLAQQQQERLWDGALPLNAVQVGDEVVLARPYHPGMGDLSAAVEAGALCHRRCDGQARRV